MSADPTQGSEVCGAAPLFILPLRLLSNGAEGLGVGWGGWREKRRQINEENK